MENNASTAGVRPGGLISTAEIKILICYVLDSVGEPIPAKTLSELLHYEGIANYFEVDSAFGALFHNGQIAAADGHEESYIITSKGAEVAKTLKTSLPFTVREKGCSIAVKLLSQIKSKRENKVEITPTGTGFTVSCTVEENGHDMISAKLFVADEQQAQRIKNSFLEHAGEVFSGMINTLTKSE